MHRIARPLPALTLAAVLMLSACGGSVEPSGDEPTVPEAVTETAENGESNGDGTGAGPLEGTEPVPDAELPGEELSAYFSEADGVAHVVGVAHDDPDGGLVVRGVPGADGEELGALPPTAEVTLAGRERVLDDEGQGGSWAEIRLGDGVGWVSTQFLGYLPEAGQGETADFSDVPPAEDPLEIASGVGIRAAERQQDGGTPGEAEWVVAAVPEGHGGGEYTVDVTGGMGDDSVAGHRYTVVIAEAGDGFELTETTSLPICLRGAGDELCL
ncbi:SH3 domain-containing protein [Sediminivirga luteola]|uniref:SH3 domain-containing protein n=1 Tax=Sediminivirga luteola TaxID=1774748 RepID=A0A8J2TZ01_9MICO|nr:SH3 domain-containing protein [Sediminivirga luteola]MCI2264190.1 hypothetical protein [Sediminivirga luteola]GGA17475.1 hypothetical protein GCM10011333_20730 [Sediminivirga luteola]